MSRGFSTTYPSQDAMVLCDGGLNNKFSRIIIEDNESPDCLNVWFENGAVETRPGASLVNTTAVGSFVCDGLYTRHDTTGAETMVAFFGGTMWQLGATTFTAVASGTSVFTAGQRVAAAEYENKMFIGNGGVEPYKWDGTYFTRHGIPAPVSAPSAGCAATGGSLTGTLSFKVTYVNSAFVEGDLSPAVTFTVTSGCVNLSNIPVAAQSFGVAARRIYLATAATYNLLHEISDNTTTTYTVETTGVTTAAPTDNGVPPKYSQIIHHRDRLFMNDPSNPNLMWYSELGNPYTVASTNYLSVGDGTSDLVRGFAKQGESILVLCDKSAWLIYMPTTDPTDWRTLRVQTAYGSRSPFAIVPYQGKVMHPAVDNDKFVGFAAVEGNATAPSTTFLTTSAAGSDLQSDRIEPDMFTVPETYIKNISGISFKNRLFFALPYGANQDTNNRVYVYDYSMSNLKKRQRGAWVPYTGWNAAQFTIYGGQLYYGSSLADGKVYKCMVEGVYSDAGSAINSYYWTKEFAGHAGDSETHKDFRFLALYYEKPASYFMNLTYRTDGDVGVGNTQQVDLSPGGGIWGSMIWGRDPWGGGQNDGFDLFSLGQSRGKRIQFKFSNQGKANQKFKVAGFRFTYNKKGVR